MGIEGLRVLYKHNQEVHQYCQNELIKTEMEAWTNEGTITIVFPKISEVTRDKWQLTNDDVIHIICMHNKRKNWRIYS